LVTFASIDFEGCVIVALLLHSQERCEVLQSACLSVFSLARLKNHMCKLHKSFTVHYLWPRLVLSSDDNAIYF